MPLLDLKTDLKSLKYGSDRPGGGDSGQPYIKTDINKIDLGFNRFRLTKFDDGLIRDGLVGATNASVTDTIRIGKFLTDFPKGPLFIVKQVGLQLSNPRLEYKQLAINHLTSGQGFLNNALNFISNTANRIENAVGPTRVYNLGINTLAQIPLTAFGGHVVRHGFTPNQDPSKYYYNVVTENNFKNGTNRLLMLTGKFNLGGVEDERSTLLKKTNKFLNFIKSIVSAATNKEIPPDNLIVDEYIGGPGSVYGIGGTFIKRYTLTRTKEQGQQDKQNPNKVIVPIEYSNALGVGDNAISNYKNIPTSENEISKGVNSNVIGSVKTYSNLIKNIEKTTTSKYLYKSSNKGLLPSSTSLPSYTNSFGEKVTIKLPWNQVTREVRVGSGRQDEINLTPIFGNELTGSVSQKSTGNKYFGEDTITIDGKSYNIRDLVKFRIQAVNTDTPENGNWMVFRAYLTELTDNTDANWNEIKYAGRGDKFFIYDGFSRKMSVSFKVAALSAEEMKPMYQKLNYLMSNLMPDYSGVLMRGPLTRMTIGNWIDSQLCVLNSLSYKIPNDTPWEIALDEPEGGVKMLILPHIVEVSLNFTLIGSESKENNVLSKKSQLVSNIAQNNTGPDAKTLQYIE